MLVHDHESKICKLVHLPVQRNFFRILAGILHLGNVGITSNGGKGDSEPSTVEEADGSLVSWKVEEIDPR